MRKAKVMMNGTYAGILQEENTSYLFSYDESYTGDPISLAMPLQRFPYSFDEFPPFFEGLLPEGIQLQGLLRQSKIGPQDYFAQLIATGQDLVGAVTVEAWEDE